MLKLRHRTEAMRLISQNWGMIGLEFEARQLQLKLVIVGIVVFKH